MIFRGTTRSVSWWTCGNPAGSEPKNIYQVETRYKDILYASRSREHIEAYRAKHDLRRKLNKLYRLLPKNLQERTEIRKIGEMRSTTTMNIIQLIILAVTGRSPLRT